MCNKRKRGKLSTLAVSIFYLNILILGFPLVGHPFPIYFFIHRNFRPEEMEQDAAVYKYNAGYFFQRHREQDHNYQNLPAAYS